MACCAELRTSHADLCLEGLDGYRVEGCGSGARVARGVLQLEEGGALTLVSVHGGSGVVAENQQWVTAGHPLMIDAIYFDHRPVVCELEEGTP